MSIMASDVSEAFSEAEDESKHWMVSWESLLVLSIIFSVTCVVLTIGRLVIRWRNLGRLFVDDYLNCVAATLVIPYSTILLLCLPILIRAQKSDFGGEVPKMDEINFVTKLQLSFGLLLWLILYTVKASFLALFWQMFSISRRFRMVWWASTVFVALSGCITIVSVLWRCGDPSRPEDYATCESMDMAVVIGLSWIWCGLHVASGFIVMSLPIVMIAYRLISLQTPQKVGLIFVFGLGILDIAFDIIRTVYTFNIELSANTNMNSVWLILEPTFATIVCSLPVYKPLLSCVKRRSGSTTLITSLPSFVKPNPSLKKTEVPQELQKFEAESLDSWNPDHSAA